MSKQWTCAVQRCRASQALHLQIKLVQFNVKARGGIWLQVEVKGSSPSRYFIQPNILFLLWNSLTGSPLSLIIPVTFEAPSDWKVELGRGYRTMAFVHQMLLLTILPLLSVIARGNKHPTVAVLLGKGTRISPVTLLISSPHTDTGVLEVRGMFSPLFSGPH